MPLTPEQLTIIGLLLAIGGLGLKKLWVFGWVYETALAALAEMRRDRDFWRDIALKAMGHTDKALAVAVAEKVRNGG